LCFGRGLRELIEARGTSEQAGNKKLAKKLAKPPLGARDNTAVAVETKEKFAAYGALGDFALNVGALT
jgi:hypothetical protein